MSRKIKLVILVPLFLGLILISQLRPKIVFVVIDNNYASASTIDKVNKKYKSRLDLTYKVTDQGFGLTLDAQSYFRNLNKFQEEIEECLRCK
jgi:hypothetical protein